MTTRDRFALRGLLPDGRYLATTVDYLEDGEDGDAELFERMRNQATPFSIREGQSRDLGLGLVVRW